MRINSDLWVKAYLRRCSSEGVSAVVVRRGDADAGVVFIKISRLDGTATLFGPAAAGLARDEMDRRWSVSIARSPEAVIDARLAQERKLDPDVWVVEVEDREGRHFLDDWLDNTSS